MFSLSHEFSGLTFPPATISMGRITNCKLITVEKAQIWKILPIVIIRLICEEKAKKCPNDISFMIFMMGGGQLVLASRTQNPKFYIVINEEDTKTIIANQLEGILIGLAMFL